MTASEFAFLAFGFAFGIATGGAIVFVLRSAAPRPEVRLTVTHDAVPRRGSTLAMDGFVTAPAEPARGGPADRRMHDRPGSDPAPTVDADYRPGPSPTPVGVPVIGTPVPYRPAPGLASAVSIDAGRPPLTVAPVTWPNPTSPARRPAPAAVATATIPGSAEILDPLGTERSNGEAPAPGQAAPAFVRMLRGDHRAMLAVVDRMAGADGDARRTWQIELTALVEATIARSIDLGVLEFPLGNPFWDSFTVDQCREIAGALASTGHAFDGLGSWADDRVPGSRELTVAVADAGLDPRRVRAWPNSAEIALLYRGARTAPEDLLAERAPDLDREAVRTVLAARAEGLATVWASWDRLRPLLQSTEVAAEG